MPPPLAELTGKHGTLLKQADVMKVRLSFFSIHAAKQPSPKRPVPDAHPLLKTLVHRFIIRLRPSLSLPVLATATCFVRRDIYLVLARRERSQADRGSESSGDLLFF